MSYQSAGTVEFIVDADSEGVLFPGSEYKGLQVEHTVTEEVTGLGSGGVDDPRQAAGELQDRWRDFEP